ncbi:uncharacterized protein LOC134290345 [Aedes albopictus]|uniref:Reverse transcriptase domain-containing protein n=1 Tax=Aedes albopictus TaxID=7160 RepID=A0ABM2A644_AEDAL
MGRIATGFLWIFGRQYNDATFGCATFCRVVYSRADKGNAVVIMDKQEYEAKVLEMINSGPYEECKYKNGKPKDPLNSLIEEANSARQKVAHLMASLYCLPKIHKNPVAMRPISSNICTPTEKMAAWLVGEMRRYPVTHGKSVRNSIELAEKLKNLEIRRGEILVSFDVTALFPNVPVSDALRSLRRHLERCRVPPNHIEAYLTVAEVCMDQNYFMFRGKFYKQTFGLSMGSKLSPLLADVFMSDFEEELQKEKIFPRIWRRYVDDIFAVVKERYLTQILQLLNTRHSSIKFTIEKETNGTLPFLDLMITRKDDNTLKFGIYRKPTSTDRYITSDSNHFGTQQQAAFHSMAHRLFNIPMEKEEFITERKKIHEAARSMNVLFAMFTKPLPTITIIIHHRSIDSSRKPPPAQCDIILTIHPTAANVCVAAFASCQFTRSTYHHHHGTRRPVVFGRRVVTAFLHVYR